MNPLADASRLHLSDLLIAIERCVFFLEGARVEIPFMSDPAAATDLFRWQKNL